MNEVVVSDRVFGWRESKGYKVLDLGTMPNAIVIKQEECGSMYLISLRGYFSFPDEYYKNRFKTEQEAIEYASRYLLTWLLEINSQLFNK
jgi:hypothetical protein